MQGFPAPRSPPNQGRPAFTAFRGRVVHGSNVAAASSSSGGAEGPPQGPANVPAWMSTQFSDLEGRKLVRAADPACNATPVEKANAAFRQNTFRVRPAHNPERFINYVCGRPVVVLGTQMFYLWVRSAPNNICLLFVLYNCAAVPFFVVSYVLWPQRMRN